MGPAVKYCECRKPKPVAVTVDTFGGLFVDEPMASELYQYCDRCTLTIQPTR